MHHESAHVRVETDDGIATVWLEFPGSPVNALSPLRLLELDRALAAVRNDPHLDAIVIRSGLPAGFCGGYVPGILRNLTSDSDAAEFSRMGQQVLARLAAVECATVAFIEGPCLGPGWELALACDYRLAVAGPDSTVGFADVGVRACWGSSCRRRTIRDATAREAQRVGLIDHAFCQRRAKIELRTWLDRIQANPRLPRRLDPTAGDLAMERAAFVRSIRETQPESRECLPESLHWDDAEQAVEIAIRGGRVAIASSAVIERRITECFAEALRRGRATPLEISQARQRIQSVDPPKPLPTVRRAVAA